MKSKIPPNESVGENFDTEKLRAARDKTIEVIQKVAKQLRPGITELEVKGIVKETAEQLGSERTWHPPQIRFGENTLLPFGVPGVKDQVLKQNDICFLDLGPVFDGHEGDVGRAFAFGDDEEMLRCAKDVEVIWNQVRDHWQETQKTGAELYHFAKQCAQDLGWNLNLKKANGHRIADFPHAAQFRGTIENWEAHPQANRWILEIQIQHPTRAFGAFYEDLLN